MQNVIFHVKLWSLILSSVGTVGNALFRKRASDILQFMTYRSSPISILVGSTEALSKVFLLFFPAS